MNCEEALILISGYIDRTNSAEEEAQLLEHLQECPNCWELVDAFREADAGLVNLRVSPPGDLCTSVMENIRAEVNRKKHYRWREFAIAACLVAAVGIGAVSIPQISGSIASGSSIADEASVNMEVETVAFAKSMTRMADSEQITTVELQELADERGADIAVTHELLPEMEICACETLENGGLLYELGTPDGAVKLCRWYGIELIQPSAGITATVSYALLLP